MAPTLAGVGTGWGGYADRGVPAKGHASKKTLSTPFNMKMFILSLSLSYTHTHSHSSLSLTHTQTRSQNTHMNTHTHEHTHTLTLTLTLNYLFYLLRRFFMFSTEYVLIFIRSLIVIVIVVQFVFHILLDNLIETITSFIIRDKSLFSKE
jgi:hypothetical protein